MIQELLENPVLDPKTPRSHLVTFELRPSAGAFQKTALYEWIRWQVHTGLAPLASMPVSRSGLYTDFA